MAYPRDKQPDAIILFQPLGIRDGQLDHDPIVYGTVADEVNMRSSDSYDGRYRNSKGEIHGYAVPKRQDAFISGTAGRTGRAFNSIHGTWFSDYQTDYSGVYGIIQQDNTHDIPYEVISADTTNGIEGCTMFVGRGALPNVPSTYQFTSTNTFLYIYLAWGNQMDFRIALEYRRPMRIDRTQNGWSTFEKVAVARDLGDTERFFSTKQHKLPIDVFVDRDNNQLVVELGDGKELATTPYNTPLEAAGVNPNTLPLVGKIRLVGQNGACSFEYYPKRHEPVVAKIRKDIGKSDHPRSAEANVVINNRSTANPNQTATSTVSQDGQIYTVDIQVKQPDAGDGEGSADPPVLVDATMIIPAVWSRLTYGAGQSGAFRGRGMSVEYWQEFDDNTNTFTSGGNLILDNNDGAYTGLQGNLAVDIWASMGGGYYKIFTGIAGAGPGITLFQVDTLGRISCPLHDFSYKMRHPIGQRLILDRMCLYNAIQLVCELGGIHPSYLAYIPKYIPPGCTADAPYGPAGADCPYPVLPSGNGTHARFEYDPRKEAWDILQELIQDQGKTDLTGSTSVPFYAGFDIDGQLHAEAFDPGNQVPVVFFQENDPSGLAQIQDISVNWCTEQMRTAIDFLGLNPWTNAPEHYHVDQPEYVKTAVGHPSRWIERNGRYSGDYLIAAAKNGAAMASLPQLTGHVTNTFIPYVNAGQRVLVYERKELGFLLDAYLRRIDVHIGQADLSGRGDRTICNAGYGFRAIANTPHIPMSNIS